ncbi:unnamed protein product [Calypogeia fissa]
MSFDESYDPHKICQSRSAHPFGTPLVRRFAISRATAILAPVEAVEDPLAISSFMTGSGKRVSVSSKALSKARTLLGEELEEPAPVKGLDDPAAITCFVTGSGKTVSTSSKAVEKARAYLGEEFEEPAPVKGLDDPGAITAFVTGSGNVYQSLRRL